MHTHTHITIKYIEWQSNTDAYIRCEKIQVSENQLSVFLILRKKIFNISREEIKFNNRHHQNDDIFFNNNKNQQ